MIDGASSNTVQRIFAFGRDAQRYARAISLALPLDFAASNHAILVCDGTDAEQALATAVDLKRAGFQLGVAALLRSRKIDAARLAAMSIARYVADPDEIRLSFEAIGEGNFRVENPHFDEFYAAWERRITLMREMLRMSDMLVVRSHTERERIYELLGVRHAQAIIFAPPESLVPPVFPQTDARKLVVWAPRSAFSEVAHIAYALSHFHEDPVYICSDSSHSAAATIVSLNRAAEVLRDASVVIDADPYDPGAALAFAERGFGLCTARSSGAHEYIDGVCTYTADDFATILSAAARARADRRTKRVQRNDFAATFSPITASAANHSRTNASSAGETLVSFVIPDLPETNDIGDLLQSIARQTHHRTEVLLAVTETTPGLAVLIERFAFLRCITITPAEKLALLPRLLNEVQGTYCVIADSRTRFFPEYLRQALKNAYHEDVVVVAQTICFDGASPPNAASNNAHVHSDPSDDVHMLPNVFFHRSLVMRSGILDDTRTLPVNAQIIAMIMRAGEAVMLEGVAAEIAPRRNTRERSRILNPVQTAVHA